MYIKDFERTRSKLPVQETLWIVFIVLGGVVVEGAAD